MNTTLVSLKYLFPPPEFLAPPPGGLWADLPARAVAHKHPLCLGISQYNGTLSALLNPTADSLPPVLISIFIFRPLFLVTKAE